MKSVSSSLVGVLSARSSSQSRRYGGPPPLSEQSASDSQTSQRPRSAPRTVNGVRTAELTRTTRFEDLSPTEQAAAEAKAKEVSAAEVERQRLKAEKIRSWLQRKDQEKEEKKIQEMEIQQQILQKQARNEQKKEETRKELEAQRARRLGVAEKRRALLRLQIQQACEDRNDGNNRGRNKGKSILTAYAVSRPPVNGEASSRPCKPQRPDSASSRPCRLSLSRGAL